MPYVICHMSYVCVSVHRRRSMRALTCCVCLSVRGGPCQCAQCLPHVSYAAVSSASASHRVCAASVRAHGTCQTCQRTCKYATCHMPYAICHSHMPYAICHMPYAICHMPYAICHAICRAIHASLQEVTHAFRVDPLGETGASSWHPRLLASARAARQPFSRAR